MEEANDNSSSSEELEANDEDERQKIKLKLSEMSFEDLLKLKEEIGTKLYTNTVLGTNKRKSSQADFKRANKNRPREMSSKRSAQTVSTHPVKKRVVRDPRFESVCGTFDRETFKSNYKFINEIRKNEKKQLEDELQNTSDANEKKRIKIALQRLNNQLHSDKMEKTNKEPDLEKSNENRKPHFKKKSVAKLETLIDKYEKLKKTNKIQKHIEKKSKKVATKERKKLERDFR